MYPVINNKIKIKMFIIARTDKPFDWLYPTQQIYIYIYDHKKCFLKYIMFRIYNFEIAW